MLYTFTPNKSYPCLNIEPSNLMFLRTYDTEFDDIIITFTGQNSRPLEIGNKVIWHCFLINRNDKLFYRTKNKKICQWIWIFVICEKSLRQIWKNIEYCNKKKTRCCKNCFQKRSSSNTWNNRILDMKNIAEKTVKSNLLHDENSRIVQEIVIPPGKRKEILNELRQVL